MLKLKLNCECCDITLAPASSDARICSFECTFCNECAQQNFKDICPNCSGELVKRPIRPTTHLEKHPGSTERYVNEAHAHCANYASRGSQG